MPYTKKQQDLARAVEHGFKPTGSAKGFSRKFAEEVTEESKYMPTKPAVRKRKRAANLGGLIGR